MPRQLPWANKGGGSRVQAKQPLKSAKKTTRISSDIDDGFFDDTVLASTTKGKRRAVFESDDDFLDLPGDSSTSRARRRTEDGIRTGRALSSSPPLIADLSQPLSEPMRKGVSMFDLRDDEWMMVEDELLDTAKSFTRYLHMAEYERLKERIEEKKKEAAIARPVVAGAKLSAEGTMKAKAKVQEKRHMKAIRDVFASQNNDNDEFSSARSTVSKQPTNLHAARDTDSDDLDAPRRPPKSTAPMATIRESLAPTRPVNRNPKSSSLQHSKSASLSSSTTFVKPAPPLPTTRPRTAASRTNRATPFDMLDDYVPRANHSVTTKGQHEAQKSRPSLQSSSPAQPSRPSSAQSGRKPSPVRPIDLFDDWGSGKNKEVADRLAKRKAEREKDAKEKEKGKAVKLDDIPTFLF
ncbi:hypothetical protein P153DRAFT_365234 [Dothidotthia symphoricarpi CBS 119687]|uniref:Uncharacterized protein n=1 Tax=Dothidotthia symphoricarpi CBS 119687 TaxID=1392245 RepID=A0A6A6AKA3_9PLEO|nr:uncharacterized protein P153DRAFT_365234 [Dothidotthia symphoricarpi CBS 119687]KAF2131663.1 hypothetical protein P153DRAFT_365234 [Dothidotthia symphoricarpi CBS 119687]